MTNEEINKRLGNAANRLAEVLKELDEVAPHLTLDCDQRAMKSIHTDLVWAIENTTVISLHAVGKAMTDDMGYSKK